MPLKNKIFLTASLILIFALPILFGYRFWTGQASRLDFGILLLGQGIFVLALRWESRASPDVKARNLLALQISDRLHETILSSENLDDIRFEEASILNLVPLDKWKTTRYLQGEFLYIGVTCFFCLSAGLTLLYSYFFSPDTGLWELFYFIADSVSKGALADFLESYDLQPFSHQLTGFGFNTISFLIKTATGAILIAAILDYWRFKSIQKDVINDLTLTGFAKLFIEDQVRTVFAIGFAAGKDYNSSFDRIKRASFSRTKRVIIHQPAGNPKQAAYTENVLKRYEIGKDMFDRVFGPILTSQKTAQKVSQGIKDGAI
jgi:hypothetical protein